MIEIKDKEKCCGCTACASACPVGCIVMNADEEGFAYPRIDADACIGCNRCERVCPIANPVVEVECPQVGYVVQSNNSDILSESTSGGAFTILAEYVLRTGGIVFGVGFNDEGFPCHKCARCDRELAEFRGSKYVQSDLSDTFPRVKDALHENTLVLFSGTPCQVEGLLSYLDSHPANLVCVDVVCHAVPSPLVWQRYLEYVGRPGFARFRDKIPYGYQYSQMSFSDALGNRLLSEGVESNPFLRSFFKHLSIRPSCFSCAFRKRYRRSDFTLWDCWDAGSYSSSLNSDIGATKVLCHSDKAKEIGRGAFLSAGVACNVDPDFLVAGEKEIVESPRYPEERDAFFRDCATVADPEVLFEKWFPISGKVVAERAVRRALSRFGLLGKLKNYVKGVAR